MALFGNKEFVGLDVGTACVKAVRLALEAKEVVFKGAEVFNSREEGILDEDELRDSLSAWLTELKWTGLRYSVGLPQYFATTQVSDFPPGASGETLDGMVDFETHQLAGISEESFISGYHVMTPDYGRENPVLIGICRESVVNERAQNYVNAGIRLEEFAMTGVAAANTLFHLHPEVQDIKTPQILLDIGHENTNMLVIAGGQVLFASSLMFGTTRYADAMKARMECSQDEAESLLHNAALDQQDPNCPLRVTTRQLESEMRASIDHWRAGERQEIADKMFTHIWLCGGGAKLAGLSDHLARTYGCQASVVGPSLPGEDEPHPELATAYGIALQGLEKARIHISLCPTAIRWFCDRKKRFVYVAAAEILFVLLACFGLFQHHRSLVLEQKEILAEKNRLEQCKVFIPDLDNTRDLMRHHEKMLIPFAELGNRAARFISTIEAIGEARGRGSWFIYLADQFSYEEGKPKEDEEASRAPETKPLRATASGLMFASSLEEEETDASTMFEAVPVTKMEQLTNMVAAGYTPYQKTNRLQYVKNIVKDLDGTELLEGVDLLSRPVREGREQGIFNPWQRVLSPPPNPRKPKARRNRVLHTPFMFRLPFVTTDVMKMADEEGKEGARR
ncbi:MAG: pilus assembly protein PilM [Lentisphaeria bacterium]|nr:pilus assembly protein PilM [Lentisphaeria bacterium]